MRKQNQVRRVSRWLESVKTTVLISALTECVIATYNLKRDGGKDYFNHGNLDFLLLPLEKGEVFHIHQAPSKREDEKKDSEN